MLCMRINLRHTSIRPLPITGLHLKNKFYSLTTNILDNQPKFR